MVEEIKQEEKKDNKVLSMILKILLGLVFLALGIWAIMVWRYDLIVLIKGSVGLLLILAALITFAIAKE